MELQDENSERVSPIWTTFAAILLISCSNSALGYVTSTNKYSTRTQNFALAMNNFDLQPQSLSKQNKIPTRLIVGSILSIFGGSLRANAGFFSSQEQDQIDEICKFQKPIAELLDQLRPSNIPNAVGVYSNAQVLKGGKEDSDVVLSYMEVFIKPCQRLMEKTAATLKLPSEEDQKKVEILPLLMKGHIAELTQAIQSMQAPAQEREVAEVQETLADFLKLASSKYTIAAYVAPRPLSDAELFGPLGCEFWGKKRVEGSNACAWNESQ